MRALTWIIAAKIVLTAGCWVPFSFAPDWFLRLLGVPVPQPILFVRLLGAGYVALLVVYVAGFCEALDGRYPALPVRVGLVSNGLAAIVLAYHGLSGAWTAWESGGQFCMWASLAATIFITAGLARFGQAFTMQPRTSE